LWVAAQEFARAATVARTFDAGIEFDKGSVVDQLADYGGDRGTAQSESIGQVGPGQWALGPKQVDDALAMQQVQHLLFLPRRF
jgi:hypothetical protein